VTEDGSRTQPTFLDEAVALERIEALTTTARTTWLVLLGFLAYIGLTLLSVHDVDFFSVTATTDLPIVNIAIPTTTFFWTAALLAAILHTYFQVFLLKLWDALAEAPPVIDKLKLGDRVLPWLVNDWALRRRPDRPVTKRPLDALGRTVTGLLVWAATPVVLIGFWLRSLPAHDARLSLFIAVACWFSLYASLRGESRARARLRRPGFDAGFAGRRRRGVVAWLGRAANKVATALLWLAILASLPLPLAATIVCAGGHHLPPIIEATLAASWPQGWGTLPLVRANLVDAEIAIKPDDWRDRDIARRRFRVDWCRDSGIPVHACETPVHPDHETARRRWCDGLGVEDCAARFQELDAAFEAEWAIEREAYVTNIRVPDLNGRDLRGARARAAFLAGVDLREARLDRADLSRSQLEGADLSGAVMRGTLLAAARLNWARLDGAMLDLADLRWARLNRVSLFGATLQGVDLGEASLVGADLTLIEFDAVEAVGTDFRSAN
jgi:hypothetical protein